jgi:hypothetical protein
VSHGCSQAYHPFYIFQRQRSLAALEGRALLCAAILHHAPVGEAEQEVERVIGMPLDEPTRATLEYIATPKGLRNRDVAALIRKLGRLSRDTLLPPAQNTEARHG